jgi:hypothetical protein
VVVRLRSVAVVAAMAWAVAACGEGTVDDGATGTTESPTETPAEVSAVPVLRPATGDIGVRALGAGVVAVPGGFLAIGERLPDGGGSGDLDTVTTFWRSADGRTWTMADADPAVWGPWTAERVAHGAAGIVVLAGGDNGRAVLSSNDGETWQVTPITTEALGLPADTFPGAYPINDVTATDTGFLALGSLTSSQGVSQPLLLTSADGVSWQRAGGPALEPGAVFPEYFAGAVAADGRQYAVVTSSDPAARVMVWRSSDGATWDTVGGPELFAGVADPVVTRVAALDGRLVAAGQSDSAGDAAVWVSDDGEAWALAPGTALGGPGIQTAGVLATQDGEWLLFGTETHDAGGDMGGVAWSSTDGQEWRRLPPGSDEPTAPTLQLVGGASNGGDVAVIGSQYAGPVDLATLQMNGWWVELVEA